MHCNWGLQYSVGANKCGMKIKTFCRVEFCRVAEHSLKFMANKTDLNPYLANKIKQQK